MSFSYDLAQFIPFRDAAACRRVRAIKKGDIASHANAEPNITWYRVEAENFESIHNHNAYALIEKG